MFLLSAHRVEELPAAVPVPDPDVLVLELLGGGGAPDEPEQLLGDPAVEHLDGTGYYSGS